MPFTFSHPAAVLPLAYLPKRWTSMTGLIIGSLSPDFEYFLRMKAYGIYSHTWIGLFWFDLPLTIILAFIFHLIVRNKLIENLPIPLMKRFNRFKNFNWTQFFKDNIIIVVASIIIGIATHIFWDGFTHAGGQFVQRMDSLNTVYLIAGYNLPMYKILQHLSTIVGGVIIIYALYLLPVNKVKINRKSIYWFWLSVFGIAIVILVIRLLTGLGYNHYGDIIVTFISGIIIGLILTAIFQRPQRALEIYK
jgi:hypothetical protein